MEIKMASARSQAAGRRFGLWAMTTATLVPVALSATGACLSLVDAVTWVCLPLVMATGLIWVGRRERTVAGRRAFRQKAGVMSVSSALLLTTVLTHWPLRLAFRLFGPEIAQLAAGEVHDDMVPLEYKKCPGYFADNQNDGPGELCAVGAPGRIGQDGAIHHEGCFTIDAIDLYAYYVVAVNVKALAGGSAAFVHTRIPGSDPVLTGYGNPDILFPQAADKLYLGDGWWFVSH